MGSWEAQFVDRQVGKAWRAFRLDLADRFVAGLASGAMDPIDFTAATGQTLTVSVDEEHVILLAGDSVVVSDNFDEAAYAVYETLHDDWQVVHPVFLDSAVVQVPSIDDHQIVTLVPPLSRADTEETLQAWAVVTFQETSDEPLKVCPNGDISWRGHRGVVATVSVRDHNWIEIWSVLATQASLEKARKVVEKLSRRYTGLNFSLRRDTVVMSRLVDAGPFVPEHLTDALVMHLDLATRLSWVQESVLRKRVKRRRESTFPPDLFSLLPSATRLRPVALARVVGSAAGSPAVLETWRQVARREYRKARALPRGASDPQRVHDRLRVGWLRLVRAIDSALEAEGTVGEVA